MGRLRRGTIQNPYDIGEKVLIKPIGGKKAFGKITQIIFKEKYTKSGKKRRYISYLVRYMPYEDAFYEDVFLPNQLESFYK
jgi:hypothetical protein